MAASDFAGGHGTPSSPYIIETDAQLRLIGDSDENRESHYHLAYDIELIKPWVPIQGVFEGTFNGGGHTLSEMEFDSGDLSSSHGGLFQMAGDGAVIQNLRVFTSATGLSHVEANYVGILIGKCENHDVTIRDVVVVGRIDTPDRGGGLIGYNYNSGTAIVRFENIAIFVEMVEGDTQRQGIVFGYSYTGIYHFVGNDIVYSSDIAHDSDTIALSGTGSTFNSNALTHVTDLAEGDIDDITAYPGTWEDIAYIAEDGYPAFYQRDEGDPSLLGPSDGPIGEISGTVSVIGSPEERPVIAIAFDPLRALAEVVAVGASASDGTFTLPSPNYTDPVMVICLDNAGNPWAPLSAVSLAGRTFPTADNHTGLVYQCTSDGTTAATEPTWPTVIGTTVSDGTVTWKAIEYYQPQAHGPVNPLITDAPSDITENSLTYTYNGMELIEDQWIQRFVNTVDAADFIYRHHTVPEDISDSGTYEYTRTVKGLVWYDEYALSTDATDLIHRTLDLATLESLLPLDLTFAIVNPNFGQDTMDGWTGTLNNFENYDGNAGGPDPTMGNISYAAGGSNGDATTEQIITFADIGLPVELMVGATVRLQTTRASYSGADKGQASLLFYDDTPTQQGSTVSDTMVSPPTGWTTQALDAVVPAASTQLKIELKGEVVQGLFCDFYITDIKMELRET